MTDGIRPERPVGAPHAIGTNLDFGRAVAVRRELESAMVAMRGELDDEIARSGAAARVRERTLARLRKPSYVRMDWRKIAAAVLVAGLLGGAIDLLLLQPGSEPADFVMVDPVLYGFDTAELR